MKKGRAVFRFRVPDKVASLIKGMHPHIKFHVRKALQAILEEPASGKPLRKELSGLRSYRVKRYRIIYRVVSTKKELEIIAIGPRKKIYEETFRIISKEETQK